MSTPRDLNRGSTRREIAAMFHITYNAALKATVDLPPLGRIGKEDLFDVAVAASNIAVPNIDSEIIERLMKLKPDQLPDELKTAYWRSKKLQQEYETATKELWPTAEIVEYMGEAFKSLRMSLQLMMDSVEREEGLSESQRQLLQKIVDGALSDMRERMIDAFKNKRKSAQRRSAPRKKDQGSDEL